MKRKLSRALRKIYVNDDEQLILTYYGKESIEYSNSNPNSHICQLASQLPIIMPDKNDYYKIPQDVVPKDHLIQVFHLSESISKQEFDFINSIVESIVDLSNKKIVLYLSPFILRIMIKYLIYFETVNNPFEQYQECLLLLIIAPNIPDPIQKDVEKLYDEFYSIVNQKISLQPFFSSLFTQANTLLDVAKVILPFHRLSLPFLQNYFLILIDSLRKHTINNSDFQYLCNFLATILIFSTNTIETLRLFFKSILQSILKIYKFFIIYIRNEWF